MATLVNLVIEVGLGSGFIECQDVEFEHCTFWADDLTSQEIVAKVKGRAGAVRCLFLGSDRKQPIEPQATGQLNTSINCTATDYEPPSDLLTRE